MSNPIILLPSVANYKSKQQWQTPVRSVVRSLRRAGKSYGEIKKETGLERSTIQHIIKGPFSRTTRKGKRCKPYLLKPYKVRRIFLFVSES